MGAWNWLDWVLAIVLVASIIPAIKKGFARELISLASVILALIIAALEYPRAATWFLDLTNSHQVAMAAGFNHLCGRSSRRCSDFIFRRVVDQNRGGGMVRPLPRRSFRSRSRRHYRFHRADGSHGLCHQKPSREPVPASSIHFDWSPSHCPRDAAKPARRISFRI